MYTLGRAGSAGAVDTVRATARSRYWRMNMSMNAVSEPLAEVSPRTMSRIAGAFFLLTILMGMFAQGFISERLVVSGDAAATATNILMHQALFRLAFAAYLIEMSSQITMTVLLYYLLKPVSRSVSLLAATFGLVGCIIKTLSRLFFISPLLVLGGAHYLAVFDAKQLQTLALLFLGVNHQAEEIAMVFFGFYAILKGYLVFRSTFLPRTLGVLSALGGVGWLTYLYPPLASRLVLSIVTLAVLGAIATALWLIAVGVSEQRWKEMASGSAASVWR